MGYIKNLLPQRAFTLIELIIVMAIIAVGAALVIPKLNSGETVKLEAQARELIATLNHARRSAIVEGKTKTVLLQSALPTDEPKLRQLPGIWESRGAEIKWAEKSEATGTLKVSFFPAGGSSGGTLLLTQFDVQVKIKIDPFNGKTMVDYERAPNI
jgi:general secretion pathway protein H